MVEPVLAAALYVAVISAVTEWWSVYQFNPDEGVNLMKAALVAEGFSLYSEIWNDQPPVFTLLLVPLQWLFPASVNAARALVLAFAALTVFCLFRIVRRADGRGAAWLAIVALAGERMFASTSVSVLIGLPAIALALAAMDQALAGARSGARLSFIAAGILFGLALQTKLFVALMLPALALAPFVDRWLPDLRRRAAIDLAVLAASIAATFSIIAVAFSEPIFAQLVAPHSEAAAVADYIRRGGPLAVFDSLSPQWFLIFAALGAVASLRSRRLVSAIPIVWLAVAGLVLVLHRPFWGHQAVLLQVPVAWLCGLAITTFGTAPARRWITAALATFVIAVSATTLYSLGTSVRGESGGSLDSPLLSRDQGVGRWVVTDYLLDAYRANSLVPPELAVFTEKRLVTGNLTNETVAESINRYLPDEVLLRRFRPTKSFIESIQHNYQPAPIESRNFHAVKKQFASARAPQVDRDTVAAALTLATIDLVSHSSEGGYPAHADLRTGRRYGRSWADEPLSENEIIVRPPGSTQEVGQCMRRAFHVTRDELFQGVANSAGRALACAQRFGGGWNEEAALHKPCGGSHRAAGADREDRPMSFDDAATPSAIEFLLDLDSDLAAASGGKPPWLDSALQVSLDSVLASQRDAGGWPQRFPETDYRTKYTFNDGATSSTIEVLLKAHEQLGEKKYLDAALRGGAFILATQGPTNQAGWAQQYALDLEPSSGRTFEPAGYASRETGDVMNTLLDLYTATADERFADAVTRARRWLEGSTIRPGVWSRLYEIGTNRPIYGDRDGSIRYQLAEISEERRTGYDWELRFPSVVRALERDDARLVGGIDALRAFDEHESEPKSLSEEEQARVVELVSQVGAEGRWADGPILSTATFVKNCDLLVRALAEPQ
jgi:PelA/Pel-15E family pectate lyase